MSQQDQTDGTAPRLGQRLMGFAKVAICVSLLAYLFHKAQQDDAFSVLQSQPKRWDLLIGAFLVAFTAVSITFIRWFSLVRALGLAFSLPDAFRLGFIGYLCNFLTLGVVGGDVMKAIFIARSQPGRRAEAVATVAVDRMIGLYALLVMAAVSFAFVDLDSSQVRDPGQLSAVWWMCQVTVILTVVGLLGILLILSPIAFKFRRWIKRVPKIGATLANLTAAVLVYRTRLPTLAVAFGMSLVTHAMFAIAIFMIALGLPGQHLDLGTHFAIVPIANLAGSMPLPGGLGAFEYALNFLYQAVSPEDMGASQGFIVALAYRVITILIAMVGLGFYRSSRREMREIADEAEHSAAKK